MDTAPYLPLLNFGLFGIVVICFAEKLFPVPPSYLMLILLGATQAADTAHLPALVIASVAGSALGSMFWYGIGRMIGRRRTERLVRRIGRYLFVTTARYRAMVRAYEGHQFWATLVGQTIPTVRIFLALPAGTLRLRLRAFVPATILGILLWNTPLICLGFALRAAHFHALQMAIATIAFILLVELTVGMVAYRLRR